jgi:hypothetical protein
MMLMPGDSGAASLERPPRDRSTGDKRSSLAGGSASSRHISAFTPSWTEERRIRREIDRVIGRALVDHAFAARLLKPTQAVHAEEGWSQARYPTWCSHCAPNVAEFARHMLKQFWGPAQGATRATLSASESLETSERTSRTARPCARPPSPAW